MAPELVVVDLALRAGVEPVERQERILNDGSRWQVYKRYFSPRAGGGARRRDPVRRTVVRRRTIRVVTRSSLPPGRRRRAQRRVVRGSFAIDWRTRAQPHLPLFVAISNGRQIFLSEHSGDAHPDGLLYIYVDDVDAVAADFGRQAELAYYGMRELELTDPDGNRLASARPPPVDGPQELVPVDPLAPARQRPLPRLPRGRLPDRVLARPRAPPRAARVSLRPGAGIVEGAERLPWRGRAARRCAAGSVSRATSSTSASTAPRSRAAIRAGRAGARRPHADAAGAGPLRLLARLGARAAPARPDRHRRRARVAAAAQVRR